MTRAARVYVVILNWNGWKDTVECLESVFRSDYPNFRVVVCDNGSTDDSMANIKSWAEGRLDVATPRDHPLRHLTMPPLRKPVEYVEYDRAAAEAGGKANESDVPLVLIHTGGNLGFAGGNNVGLRYALALRDFEYAWLLNNDTIVEPNALGLMVDRMRKMPEAGMCGSTLLYYYAPDKVQALGGATYNKWLSTMSHIGAFTQAKGRIDTCAVESRMSYVIGASMLVSKAFVDEIGLMSEEYFLYFEEIDWATRAVGKFGISYAEGTVYHKEGASTGATDRKITAKSELSEWYAIRNRIKFTRKHFPLCLPTVYLGIGIAITNRIRRRQWRRVAMILRILITT
jgi:hypothetical protein